MHHGSIEIMIEPSWSAIAVHAYSHTITI